LPPVAIAVMLPLFWVPVGSVLLLVTLMVMPGQDDSHLQAMNIKANINDTDRKI